GVANALGRGAGEKGAESGIIERHEICQRGAIKFGARTKLGFAAHRGELVPWADGEAIIAAIDAVAHGAAELARDRALMLDAVIGEALSGIELEGRGKSVGWANVEAARAGAAAFLERLGRWQINRGENGAEKKPGPEI